MSWRIIIIASDSKIDLKMNYLVIRSRELRKVHLSEVSVLILESTAISMTAALLCELCRRKIKIIFCDETHNPYGELIPYYGSHDSPDKLRLQMRWGDEIKSEVWVEIVRDKIMKQASVLDCVDPDRSEMLRSYADCIEPHDATNREGHAAKVYFNTLFGTKFSRKDDNAINSCLNYGYAIILSAVNREISALGFNTQIGIFHDNTFNKFNLGSDLMEPLRPMVDRLILDMDCNGLNPDSKRRIADILNEKVTICDKVQYLNNAIGIYVKSVTDSLCNEDTSQLRFCEYGL